MASQLSALTPCPPPKQFYLPKQTVLGVVSNISESLLLFLFLGSCLVFFGEFTTAILPQTNSSGKLGVPVRLPDGIPLPAEDVCVAARSLPCLRISSCSSPLATLSWLSC